jgi:hypothetical protein
VLARQRVAVAARVPVVRVEQRGVTRARAQRAKSARSSAARATSSPRARRIARRGVRATDRAGAVHA